MLRFIPFPAQAGISGCEESSFQMAEVASSLQDLLIDHEHATFLGWAEGSSMVGEGIFDGDLLIISRKETVKNGDVIVANLNGCFVCKKLDTLNESLVSSGSKAGSYKIKEGDIFQVEGVVIRSIRMHRPINIMS